MNQKEFELFKSLFDTSPNLAILHIHDNCDRVQGYLERIVQSTNGELTTKAFKTIEPNQFRLKDRNFEYAIISDSLHKIESIDRFITNIYHSLENSAFIILLQKKETMSCEEMKEILDRNNLRAVNDIAIFEGYFLVMGKKLHMWGAGQ